MLGGSDEPPDSTDEALVAAARDGQRWACALLFRRHAPRVLSLLRSRGLDAAAEVDDVVQEAFIRAFGNLDRLQKPGSFGPWVFSISRRLALLDQTSSLRRAAREAEFFALANEDVARLESEQEPARQVVRELVHALEAGAEKDTILRFYFGPPTTTAQLATELGVAKGTVTSRLSRFRARVKRRLLARLGRPAPEKEEP